MRLGLEEWPWSRATGLNRDTMTAGLHELDTLEGAPAKRVRKAGGRRRRIVETDPTLVIDLDALINSATRGDPESPLRGTSNSTLKLAAA